MAVMKRGSRRSRFNEIFIICGYGSEFGLNNCVAEASFVMRSDRFI